MSVKNFYPGIPVVPFFSSSVEMGLIIGEIRKLDFPAEVKRTAYIMIRNETANGKKVVNGTNVCGVQSDSGKWPGAWDAHIVATCVKKENMTGRERGFAVFDTLSNGIAFLCERIVARGLFIGENVDGKYHKGDITTPAELADGYNDEWVHGKDHQTTATEIRDFSSMYNQAVKIFP